MSKPIKFLVLGLAVLLILVQFVGTERPEIRTENPDDLFAGSQVEVEISGLVRLACYDCHSMETNYPWYGYVAPVSWLLFDHIAHGRKELNFSEWATLDKRTKLRKLKDVQEVVESGAMPLDDYVMLHPEAQLTDEQRAAIADWAKNLAGEVIRGE